MLECFGHCSFLVIAPERSNYQSFLNLRTNSELSQKATSFVATGPPEFTSLHTDADKEFVHSLKCHIAERGKQRAAKAFLSLRCRPG